MQAFLESRCCIPSTGFNTQTRSEAHRGPRMRPPGRHGRRRTRGAGSASSRAGCRHQCGSARATLTNRMMAEPRRVRAKMECGRHMSWYVTTRRLWDWLFLDQSVQRCRWIRDSMTRIEGSVTAVVASVFEPNFVYCLFGSVFELNSLISKQAIPLADIQLASIL